jgi:hypothetical protein
MLRTPQPHADHRAAGNPNCARSEQRRSGARAVPDRPSYGAIAAATLLSRMAGIGSLMRNWAPSPIRQALARNLAAVPLRLVERA